MNAEDREISRAEVYSFLAAVFIQEPDRHTLAKQLQVLRPEAGPPAVDEALVAEIRQQYFDCFFVPMAAGYTPPFESTLLGYAADKSFGPLSGPAAHEVQSLYCAVGFDPAALDTFGPLKEIAMPDHVGFELAYMAYLALQEEAARGRGDQAAARKWALWQRDFLAQHLARWLPRLAEALAARQGGFYADAAAYAAGWVEVDLEELEDGLKEGCSRGQQ
jgi:TorA maturation chaperone TorD